MLFIQSLKMQFLTKSQAGTCLKNLTFVRFKVDDLFLMLLFTSYYNLL